MGNSRQLRFVVASVCAAQLLTLASGARAKGQLAGSGGIVDAQDGDAAVIRTVTNGRDFSFCETPPTLTQCESPTYAYTSCGDWWGDKIRVGDQTACNTLCAAPTLTDCESSTYHLSLCGVVDARARQVIGSAPNIPNIDCTGAAGTCAQVLCEEFNRAGGSIIGAAPLGSAVRPLSVNPGTGDATRDRLAIEANGWGDPQDLETVPLLEGSRTDFRAAGTGVHYWSRMLRDQARFLGAFGALMPTEISNARAAFLTDREQWALSPAGEFNSCDEYVYEKYYDFSLFEDVTRAAATDFRKVFDVAYGLAVARSSIGTRGINGTGFVMRDGTPLDVQLRFKQNVPRNVFHAFEDRVTAAERTQAITAWESSNRTYTLDIGGEEIELVTTRPLFQSTTTFINLIGGFPFVAMDASLFTDLQDPVLHDESFAFHRDMSTALAAYPDEVLFLYDRLKDEMVQLMERRRGIENDLFRLLGTFGDEGLGFLAVDERVFDPSIFENPTEALMTPFDDVIFQQRDAFERFDAEAGLVVDSMRILGGRTVRGESLLGEAAAGAQNRSGGGGGIIQMADNNFAQSVGYVRDVAGTTSSSAGFPQRDTGSSVGLDDGPRAEHSDPIIRTATRLLRELVAVDAEIEVLMRQARAAGCIGEPDNVVAPCDWSPRDFAESVEDQLLTEREQDHARCIGFTGDDFSALRIDEDVPGRFDATISEQDEDDRPDYQGVECDDPAYNTGTLRFERYTGCRDAWRRLIMWNISNLLDYLEDLLGDGKDLLDPVTGELRPNQQTGDGDSFGDSTFGASYSYNAGWEMGLGTVGDSDRFCDSRPQMNASFSVIARIFGAEADIVDASIAAGLGQNATNRASLEVLGVSMIDVERDSEVPAAQFNVIFAEGKSDYDEYFSASATFAVGPIPVTVSAGAGGIIAAGIEARGGDRPNGAGCEQGDLAIEGMFQPSYSLIGFASAGVDALVVEAGVKIDVLIVGLSFPFTTAIVFDGDMIEGVLDAKVTITNDLDMVFSILGGRMAAYVEVCFFICEEWDFTIFEWAPTRLSQNLFHSSIDFGLNALLRAQEHLPVAVMPGGT